MNLFTDFPSDREEKREALPVSRLLRRMRNLLEIEIGEVWVEGEVSNLRKQGSGHWYFSLKDEGGQIVCAMFGARRRPGSEVLEDGAKVRVFGEVTVYEARGTAQLVVKEAEAVGAGALQAQFEALKRKLDGEGLFDASLKKTLPKFPTRIGIVTSGSSAALQDMINVLSRRAPWVTVYLSDVLVQGKGAERGIAKAIERIGNWKENGLPECDVVIVGRGGGSLEDLWNFNEEVVARAIAACPIPIVSAVGHEIDFTIADFVADLRAPTPSAAAELVVPERSELEARVQTLGGRLQRRLEEGIRQREEALRYLKRTGVATSADAVLREPMTRLDDATERLERGMHQVILNRENLIRELSVRCRANRPSVVLARRGERLKNLGARQESAMEANLRKKEAALARLQSLVEALGPASAFERGFSITMDSDGKVLKDASLIKSGMRLETMMKGGVVSSTVD
ncbi:exodeoxyribonuclease VII large subunit [Roseibacillus persicicus]|uniref:Exodeoxyribonuclease 7 large subunit n=1 Tax=Roseibacillus persicicus TaxID=454148 RepID=A0A918TX17_9BACT|nr:exodeoxyribonuclease VII large subunit [Roseibacillus persicicus]GHC66116.1 exodeoxyribonuclease 7 large subunit [Roseibacillus persicicus]